MDNVCSFLFFTITVRPVMSMPFALRYPVVSQQGLCPFMPPLATSGCATGPRVFMQISDYNGGDSGWWAPPPRGSV